MGVGVARVDFDRPGEQFDGLLEAALLVLAFEGGAAGLDRQRLQPLCVQRGRFCRVGAAGPQRRLRIVRHREVEQLDDLLHDSVEQGALALDQAPLGGTELLVQRRVDQAHGVGDAPAGAGRRHGDRQSGVEALPDRIDGQLPSLADVDGGHDRDAAAALEPVLFAQLADDEVQHALAGIAVVLGAAEALDGHHGDALLLGDPAESQRDLTKSLTAGTASNPNSVSTHGGADQSAAPDTRAGHPLPDGARSHPGRHFAEVLAHVPQVVGEVERSTRSGPRGAWRGSAPRSTARSPGRWDSTPAAASARSRGWPRASGRGRGARRPDCPVAISYRIAPRENWSDCVTAGRPAACSGDM